MTEPKKMSAEELAQIREMAYAGQGMKQVGATEVFALRAHIAHQEQEIERLRAALKYYADPSSGMVHYVARQALAQIETPDETRDGEGQ